MNIPAPELTCPPEAAVLAKLIADCGGRALLVGGWVRDALLGLEAPDLDIEVFGLDPAALEALLAEHYRLDHMGRAFGILKLQGLGIDVSVPRRETKTGPGHRGFLVDADPDLTFDQAALRRDFTFNAMGYDPMRGELIDPCGGRHDLQNRLLRHTSEKFTEDPLRVLRGMQFCARFELKAVPATIDLCRTVDLEGLAPERIFPEWRKLILQGARPSLGLTFLRATGWLRFFPELEALIDCPQDPRWHPEGDVWTHILHSMDVFASERIGDPVEDLVVGLAVLCHDLGKPRTTTVAQDAIHSRGHAAAGEVETRTFLGRLKVAGNLVEQVVPLVREHSRPLEFFKAGASEAAVRRLAGRVGRIDRLVRVARADVLGRPPLKACDFPAGDWLSAKARALKIFKSGPLPLVRGRHLIALGRAPGPEFQPLLDECFQAQLDGVFQDEAGGVTFLRSLLDQ